MTIFKNAIFELKFYYSNNFVFTKKLVSPFEKKQQKKKSYYNKNKEGIN